MICLLFGNVAFLCICYTVRYSLGEHDTLLSEHIYIVFAKKINVCFNVELMCSRFEEICVCLEDVRLLYEMTRRQQMGGPTDGSGHPPSPHQHDSRTCPLSFLTSAIASPILSFPSQSPPTLAGSVLLTGHMLICALTAGFVFCIGRRLCFVHWSQDLVGAFVAGVVLHLPQAFVVHWSQALV